MNKYTWIHIAFIFVFLFYFIPIEILLAIPVFIICFFIPAFVIMIKYNFKH